MADILSLSEHRNRALLLKAKDRTAQRLGYPNFLTLLQQVKASLSHTPGEVIELPCDTGDPV